MAKGFESFSPELTLWLKEFPEKGWMALGLNPDLVDEAIRLDLITDKAPYKLTSKGLRVYKNL